MSSGPPHKPYFVEKYKNWETLSVPKSWLTYTTSCEHLTKQQLHDERAEAFAQQREDYLRACSRWDMILKDRADAKERALRKQVEALRTRVAKEAARIARLRSEEHKAAVAAAKAAKQVRDDERRVRDAEKARIAAEKEADKPKSARTLRREKRGVGTRKNRK